MDKWEMAYRDDVRWWFKNDSYMLVINKRAADSEEHNSDKFWLWSYGRCVCGPFDTLEAAKVGYMLVAPNHPRK